MSTGNFPNTTYTCTYFDVGRLAPPSTVRGSQHGLRRYQRARAHGPVAGPEADHVRMVRPTVRAAAGRDQRPPRVRQAPKFRHADRQRQEPQRDEHDPRETTSARRAGFGSRAENPVYESRIFVAITTRFRRERDHLAVFGSENRVRVNE